MNAVHFIFECHHFPKGNSNVGGIDSCQIMDQDGFTLVTEKTRIKKKGKELELEFNPESINNFLEKIQFPIQDFVSRIPPMPVICYGIGPLSNRASVIQLKFLLGLAERMPSVSIYDPISTTQEIEFYTQLGFHWIDFSPFHQDVLYYMIHCEHFMYKQILEQSNRFALIGNHLEEYGCECETVDIDFGEYQMEFYGTRLHFVGISSL
jgi:hypothetical protein